MGDCSGTHGVQTEPRLRERTNYNGIDVVKFICAYLVCVIHIPPFQGEGLSLFAVRVNFYLQNDLGRVAVPFYFTVSGFLLFRKMSLDAPDLGRIRRYCFKILLLLGIWTTLLIHGNTEQLWYLSGLVVGVLLLTLCLKHLGVRRTVGLAAVLYMIGLLGDSYQGFIAASLESGMLQYPAKLLDLLFGITRNGFFFGMPYLLMGALLSKWKKRVRPGCALVGFCLSMAAMTAEVYLLKHYSVPRDYNMLVFLLPATLFLFLLASSAELKDRPIYRRLRVYGQLVYFLHYFVSYFNINYLCVLVAKLSGIELSRYDCFLTVILSTCAAVFLEALSRTERFSVLKYLLS